MRTLFILLFLLFSGIIYGQTEKIPIDYFAQEVPDTIPVVFAHGVICLDDRFEARGAFSPDGSQFCFTVTNEDFTSQKTLCSKYVDRTWTVPDTASFSKANNNHEPFFSYNGEILYFTSDRDKLTKENTRDLFYVNKLGNSWSEPIKLDSPINSDYTELYFDQSEYGTIYFASNRPGGFAVFDIYFAKPVDGEYDSISNIGSTINFGYAADPCIAPDESYIIFASARRMDADNTDLYISFNENGKWSDPINMGSLINTKANEYGPFFSPDSKYLFFVRHDGENGDIYWISADIINNYKR